MKRSHLHSVFMSCIFILLGIILMVWPGMSVKSICYGIGGILVAVGLFYFISYFTKSNAERYYRNDMVIALVLLLIGWFLIRRAEMVISIIPFVLGLFIIASGLEKFQTALDFHLAKQTGWVWLMVVAVVNVAFGIILVVNPFKAATTLFFIIGFGLVYSGVFGLISHLVASRKFRDILDAREPKVSEAPKEPETFGTDADEEIDFEEE
ncbi:MAG: HdeD family acid-resistance protein [Lachnospiraceae bacterium]